MNKSVKLILSGLVLLSLLGLWIYHKQNQMAQERNQDFISILQSHFESDLIPPDSWTWSHNHASILGDPLVWGNAVLTTEQLKDALPKDWEETKPGLYKPPGEVMAEQNYFMSLETKAEGLLGPNSSLPSTARFPVKVTFYRTGGFP